MSRWQPVRAGIRNVWRYYDEVFTFERGRLLLRGPNGSGKSKALEVLLPFLLDASTQPSRLSTFGDTARTMHWNLMGEGARGTTRVGFVWLELAKETGETLTIGARLQATSNHTRVDPTYFHAHTSIGEDLLLTIDDVPLTVAQLKEALDGRGLGKVFATAEEYRHAVRERLFPTMSVDRYNTLVHALLQLRRPKLSEHLDPELLSGMLSSALPPIDELQIRELAEGFERLDEQRAQLEALAGQARVARDYVGKVARYARAEVRAHARSLTQATTALDNAATAVNHGEQTLQQHHTEAAQADAAATEANAHYVAAASAKEALERSDAYAEGSNLAELRERVNGARATAERSEQDAQSADERLASSRQDAEETRGRAEEYGSQLGSATQAIDAAAVTAGLTVTEYVKLPDVLAPDDAAEERARWQSHLTGQLDEQAVRSRSRVDEVEQVQHLVREHTHAVDERTRQELRVEHVKQQFEVVQQELTDADRVRARELETYDERVTAWGQQAQVLPIERTQLEAALDAFRDFHSGSSALEPTPRVEDVVAAALGEVQQQIDRRIGELGAQRRTIEAVRAEAAAERDELLARTAAEPERSPWRDEEPGLGAPLWRLVDSVSGVSREVLAGLEAALQGSGLLDSWVFPDGSVELAGHDVVLGGASAVTGHNLGSFLKVDSQTRLVPATIVDTILRSIQVVDESSDELGPWISTDGRWRFGPQHGRWTKPAAQFIGAEARERHRQERIAALTDRIAQSDADLADLASELATLNEQGDLARREAQAVPSNAAVLKAVKLVDHVQLVVQTRQHDLAEAQSGREAAEQEVDARWQRATSTASRTRLPLSAEELEAFAQMLKVFLDQVGQAQRMTATYAQLCQELADKLQRVADDKHQAERFRDRAHVDAESAQQLDAKLQELDATRGAEFRQVQARIKELELQMREFRQQRDDCRSQQRKAEQAVVRLSERLATAEETHHSAMADRDAAQEKFAWLMRTQLISALDLDGALAVAGDRVRPTLDLARQLLRELPSDESSSLQLSHAMHEAMREAASILADRAQLDISEEQGVMVPTALHGGRRTAVSELLEAVSRERERTLDEVSQGEAELFRRILTGDTRRHLASRIRDAGELVAGMNQRLGVVQTSSQVRVRLVWEVRKDEGNLLARARDLLLRTPDRLSEDDDTALTQFLEERIQQARESQDGATWAQQLAQVFDYTRWHQFRVQMARGATGDWKPLTKKTHSALSGGEKAIALHLPLFAALAAHYEATPGAPRLILLDEVFVGIDTANRGEIFGLLAELDLDLMLTSDHEWGSYQQVDGIAIHALTAGDDDDAVTSTRFVWNGNELVSDPMADGMLL